MDIQLEVRSKSEYLEELEYKIGRMKQEAKDRDLKRYGNRLAKGDQFNKTKTINNKQTDEVDIEEKYDNLEQ